MTINIKRSPNYIPGTSRIATKGSGGGINTRFLPSGILTPDNFDNLLAWYKADSLTLSDGDPVTSFPDSSGNGLDLNDLFGSGSDPSYVASDPLFNSKPVVYFPGGRCLRRSISNEFPLEDDPFAIYVVGYSRTNNQDFLFGWGKYGMYGTRVAIVAASYVASNAGGYYVDAFGLGAGGSYSSPSNVPYIFSYSYSGGGSDLASSPNIFYQNDVPHATGVSGFPFALGYNGYVYNNIEVVMGCQSDGYLFPMLGKIAEVIVYNQYHDLATKQQIWSYLNDKYQVY